MENKKIYTAEDMGEILQITAGTVKEYVRDGKLTAFKVGREWRFTEEDLYKFVEARRKEREGVK